MNCVNLCFVKNTVIYCASFLTKYGKNTSGRDAMFDELLFSSFELLLS